MADQDEVGAIIALIKYEVEYADTHGGCPPAVKAIHRHGVKEAKAAINTLLVEARKDELIDFNLPQYDHSKCIDKKTCIGYENAQSDFDNEKELRIAELEAELKGDE